MNTPTEMSVVSLQGQDEADGDLKLDRRSRRHQAAAAAAAGVLAFALGAFFLVKEPGYAFGHSDSYVVLMRHADAPGRNEPDDFALDDCSTQRNLSDKGRGQARAVGNTLRARALDVRSVVSSRWCRTRETAKLLGFSQLRDERAFDNLESNKEHADSLLQAERGVIQNWRGPGVLVVVTHSSNLRALTGLDLEAGSMIIAESKKDGSIQFRPSSIVLKDLFS
jgi:phosphohistidine phosphatase SixA